LDATTREAMRASAFDSKLDPAFRAQVLTLPSDLDIACELGENVDPDAVVGARQRAQIEICKAFGVEGFANIRALTNLNGGADHAGIRALKNALLVIMLSDGGDDAIALALEQFQNATNMTNRLGALTALLAWKDDHTQVAEALNAYYRGFEHEPLAIDKWFSVQATVTGERGLERVQALLGHEAFTLQNPNRARSLLGVFAMRNLSAFHRADGAGYEMFAGQVLAIDKFNPQLAARLLTAMNNWRTLESNRQAKAQDVLLGIAATTGLSRDTSEIVDRCLEE
ncbi:MAG: aminopeptidase N C-terminal domain-containing protein, partial [Rhizobiaceae bacterium]